MLQNINNRHFIFALSYISPNYLIAILLSVLLAVLNDIKLIYMTCPVSHNSNTNVLVLLNQKKKKKKKKNPQLENQCQQEIITYNNKAIWIQMTS